MSLRRTPLFNEPYTVVWDGCDKTQPYLNCRRDAVRELPQPAPRRLGPGRDSQGIVLAALRAMREPATVRALSDATGVPRETCRVIVLRALRRRVVVEMGRRRETRRHYAQTYLSVEAASALAAAAAA